MTTINIFQQKHTKSSVFCESTKSQHQAYAEIQNQIPALLTNQKQKSPKLYRECRAKFTIGRFQSMCGLSFFQAINQKSSDFYESTKAQCPAHTKNAKFNRDFHSHSWRQTRPHAAGFFSSVEYVMRGFMPGSCGLRDDENRNKHVAYQLGDGRTRQFLHSSKNLVGVIMTANTLGALVQNLLARLPKRAVRNIPPKTTKPATGQITYQHTNTSMIAYIGDNAVAWIFPGAHTGQIDKKKVSCTFWDVAYEKQNSRGRYLETNSFDTGAEALDFVSSVFNFGGNQ